MKNLKATAVNKHSDQDSRGLRILKAKLVYLSGDATSIGRLGRFLLACADEMRSAKSFHRHFRDFRRDWDSTMVDVVVDRALPKAKRKPNKALETNRR